MLRWIEIWNSFWKTQTLYPPQYPKHPVELGLYSSMMVSPHKTTVSFKFPSSISFTSSKSQYYHIYVIQYCEKNLHPTTLFFVCWLPKSQTLLISSCLSSFCLNFGCFYIHFQFSPHTWSFLEKAFFLSFLYLHQVLYVDLWTIQAQQGHLPQGIIVSTHNRQLSRQPVWTCITLLSSLLQKHILYSHVLLWI